MLTSTVLTIKQVANLVHLTPDTIRYYDKAGLLPHLQRNSNGYRYFQQTDLNDIRTIQCFRQIGVSVEAIAKLMQSSDEDSETDIAARQKAVATQREQLQAQRDQIDLALLMIDIKNDHYTAVLAGQTHHTVAGEQAITTYVSKRAIAGQSSVIQSQLHQLFTQQKNGQELDQTLVQTLLTHIQPRYQLAVETVSQWVNNF